MSFETIKNRLGKFIENHIDLVLTLLVVVVIGTFIFRDYKLHPETYKEYKPPAYTVKVVDEKGNTTVLYKDKFVEIEGNVIYVCPVEVNLFSCVGKKDAIRLTGNFMVEREP